MKLRPCATHRKDEVDARHFVDDEGLKPEEEDRKVVHPLQHGGHCSNVHQVPREEQTQQQHLHAKSHTTPQQT